MHFHDDVLAETAFRTYTESSRKPLSISSKIRYIFKLFIPPLITGIYNELVKRNSLKSLYKGIFNQFSQIPDESPWQQDYRLVRETKKLEALSERIFDNNYMSRSLSSDWLIPLYYISSLISESGKCNIIDFGGGTGYSYFSLYPYFIYPKNIFYNVIDINEHLLRLGIDYANKENLSHLITFSNELISSPQLKTDIVFINTALQYIENTFEMLDKLIALEPEYFILTRLIAGDIEQFITCQYVHGKSTPCIFLNIRQLDQYFNKNKYKLIFKAQNIGENLFDQCSNNIPVNFRIRNTVNLIFKRKFS